MAGKRKENNQFIKNNLSIEWNRDELSMCIDFSIHSKNPTTNKQKPTVYSPFFHLPLFR